MQRLVGFAAIDDDGPANVSIRHVIAMRDERPKKPLKRDREDPRQ
jgi:hypothetical protein